MSTKTHLKPVAAAIGATFAVSLLSVPVNAAENPFQLNDLSASGYMVADAHEAEGKCGEGGKDMSKDGSDDEEAADQSKDTSAEGKCGEGKCGEKRKAHEGKCGADKKEEKK